MALRAITECASQEAGVTRGSSSTPSLCPQQPVQDLGAQREVSSRGRNGLGASGKEGAQPAVTGGGQLSPQHTHTYRITPTEPLHFPCVLGKCKTGTEVLRKDKGGGRGRWPGFSPRHKGGSQEEEKPGPQSTRCFVPVPRRRQQLWGEVNLGPPGSPSPALAGEGTSH